MDLPVGGKRVIVTAGGTGIGKAIVDTFISNGARVHTCDVIEERLDECRQTWPDLGTTVADVSDPLQVERLFEEATTHLGGLDVLVNNAGISGPTGPVDTLQPDDWDQTMKVNINGQFYTARLAVPLLKAAGGGNIINISSTAGIFGYPLRSPYAASKWAVIGFTKTLAMELGEFGIQANAICPGTVDGPRMDRVMSAEAEANGVPIEKIREGYLGQVSMRTFVSGYDIANMALFLCTEAGQKISGQALSVDGNGETLRTL
ncbi:MAG: SDR family oxidoreductase [Actinomycetia bacterium]|nr:SDR family oxidoreductase [Actinomycetes bacterium]